MLVSDGVTEYGTTWIINEIEKWKYESPQKLSQRIASMATEKASDGKHDDITVVSLLVS
ncbi:hypothetical protein SDC9_131968 [bioreactor metagenome]|uniref:Uncharacterized protein n=1 Tax=bioreactor metagenome TaxID=1076179 RepID=A0A645D8G0_9ZZZZ